MREEYQSLLHTAETTCDKHESECAKLTSRIQLGFDESCVLTVLYAQSSDVFSVGEVMVAARHNRDLIGAMVKQIRAAAFITEKTSGEKVTDTLANSKVENDALVVTAQTLLIRAESIYAKLYNLHSSVGERGDCVKTHIKNMWLMEKAGASQADAEGAATLQTRQLREKRTDKLRKDAQHRAEQDV